MFLYCVYEIIGTSYIFKGTTIGRKAMNIRVVNSNYKPLTLGQAVIRLVCKGISTISMGIGFLMIIFTKKKQSLHKILSCVSITPFVLSAYKTADFIHVQTAMQPQTDPVSQQLCKPLHPSIDIPRSYNH